MPIVLLYILVEALAVVGLAWWIGIWPTLLIIVVGSLLGLLLARREGVRAARALATAVQNGRLAHAEATDGLLIALGGVLLFVPGLVTDLLGLALVFPPTRALARRRLVAAAERRAPDLKTARIREGVTIVDGEAVRPDPGPGRSGPPVIEGEIVERRDR